MHAVFVIAELVPFLASLGTDVLRIFGPLRRRGAQAGTQNRRMTIDDSDAVQPAPEVEQIIAPLLLPPKAYA